MVVVDEGSGKLEKLFGKYYRFAPWISPASSTILQMGCSVFTGTC